MKRIIFEPKNIKKGEWFFVKEFKEPSCVHIARFIGYTINDKENILQYKFKVLYTTSQQLKRKYPTLNYTYYKKGFEFYKIKTPEEATVELL